MFTKSNQTGTSESLAGSVMQNQNLKRRNQQYNLLRSILLVQIVLTGLVTPVYILGYYLTDLAGLLFVVGEAGAHFLITLLIFLVLPPSKRVQSRRLDIAIWLSIITWILELSVGVAITGATSGVVSMLLWAPMLAAILGVTPISLVITMVITIFAIVLSIISQGFGWVVTPLNVAKDLPIINAFIWAINLCMLLAGLLIFRARLEQTVKESITRAEALAIANYKIEEFTRAGANISNRLTGTTAELKATSHQQVSGASEQAASIVQATSSLEELAETTRQIATNSGRVGQAASQSLVLAREVEAKSESVNQLTEQGLASVQGTISAVEAVRNRIEGLAQRLLVLTERSKEIGNIVELMRDIADETHMLALNAAIESADSKASSSNEGGGRRFGVIAGEVKNLADRSLESAQEVQKVIIEVQGAIATAVLTAEEGKKDTIKAVNQVYTSGEVIEQLGQAVGEAVRTSAKIVEVTNQVTALIEEITLATHQQTSASDQVSSDYNHAQYWASGA
jgi:methyl-accepting chemotaxis protein